MVEESVAKIVLHTKTNYELESHRTLQTHFIDIGFPGIISCSSSPSVHDEGLLGNHSSGSG